MNAIEKAKQIAAKLAAKRPHDYVEKEPMIEDPALAYIEHQRSYSKHAGIGSTGRPMKQSHTTIKKELNVPRQFIGLIVGKSGETLKKIERDHRVKCQVTQENDHYIRIIEITGTETDVKDAEMRILGMMNDKRSDSTSDYPIESQKVGLIIGKGGETIQSLQRKSGARISIQPDDGRHVRIVHLSGSSSAIDMAKKMINDILGGSREISGDVNGQTSEIMTVPKDKVGLIIGKGGETIRGIKEQCHVRIFMDQNYGAEVRNVTISGSSQNISKAKQMIGDRIGWTRGLDYDFDSPSDPYPSYQGNFEHVYPYETTDGDYYQQYYAWYQQYYAYYGTAPPQSAEEYHATQQE